MVPGWHASVRNLAFQGFVQFLSLLSISMVMEFTSLPTEIILSNSLATLAYLTLEGNPQPGTYLEVAGQRYLVLERRHRYLLRSGSYQLHKIALYVQQSEVIADKRFVDGRWVIGDITCLYNAQSELLRCAINPAGPCDCCSHYQQHASDPAG